MAYEEKRAWIRLVVAVLGYAAYVIVVLGRLGGRALADVPYSDALRWTVGLAVIASVVAETAMGSVPGTSRATDERDREIGRLGERVGQSFVVIGAVAAMLMAMAEWDRFWIAKVVAYRRGVPQW
jgi:hypothetical protein